MVGALRLQIRRLTIAHTPGSLTVMRISRSTSQIEYDWLERRIIALSATDAVERTRLAERCYSDVLAREADCALTREQRDRLLTLLQSVVETPHDES